MDTILVTTTIPYVNARPHVGFALELIQADAIARLHRQAGDDVFFLSGTDENALKNVAVASEQGLTPTELCDQNAEAFAQLIGVLGISTDDYIRTSSDRHHRGAQKFWRTCQDDIVARSYTGRYCLGCEDFYLERDLENGLCPIHKKPLASIEEDNYFFGLTKHTESISSLLDKDDYRITPSERKREAQAFLDRGLQDFSISRSSGRSEGWGVPVPDDPDQTLYVWFDALTNYLNGVGYAGDPDLFEKYWQNAKRIVHVIGKDVLKFHALYWPGMLFSAGLRPPTDLHVHGFLTVDGQKISKSVGNAVDPVPVVEEYGADALRYYLLRYVPSGSDSDFSHDHFSEVYEGDLANGLGNLVSRLEALSVRAGLDRVTEPHMDQVGLPDPEDRRFNVTIGRLWETVRTLNRSIESNRPWEYLQRGETRPVCGQLEDWIGQLLLFAVSIQPFLPDTSREITRRFTTQISRRTPLFPRI